MIIVGLGPAAWARVRLSLSPVTEAISWLRLVVSGSGHPLLDLHRRAVTRALRDPDLALIAELMDGAHQTRYLPNFLTPIPAAIDASQLLEAQLETITETTRAVMLEQLGVVRDLGGTVSARTAAMASSGVLGRHVASGLRTLWVQVIAEHWPSLAAQLDAEVRYRREIAGRCGIGLMLAGLHPAIEWAEPHMILRLAFDDQLTIDKQDFVITPSALTWGGITAQVCGGNHAMLTYPIAAPRVVPHPARHELLGGGRTAILRATRIPRSTSRISAEVSLAASTVSYHLQVLTRAGLVESHRQGRCVLYSITHRGMSIAHDADPT